MPRLNLVWKKKKARPGTIDMPPPASMEDDIASSAVFAAIAEMAVMKEMNDVSSSAVEITREMDDIASSVAATAEADMEIIKWMNDMASSVAATKAERAITREMNDIASSAATAEAETAKEKCRLLVSESTTQPLPHIWIDNLIPCTCGEFDDVISASTVSTSTYDNSSYSGDSTYDTDDYSSTYDNVFDAPRTT
jgi:hypothetical protein